MPRKGALDYRGFALANPDVERWYRYRQKRSPVSADINLRNLLRSLHLFGGKVPADLLKMKQAKLDDYVQDLSDFLLANGTIGSTVKKYVEAIKSYLKWHRRQIMRPLSIPGGDDNPNAEGQTIPDQEKLGKFFDACDQRTSVMGGLEAFAGLRPGVLGKLDGSDGLRLGDFPELVITATDVSFTKVPTVVKVRKELSKTRKAYLTFLGPQGCEYLLGYLRSRMAPDEKLGPGETLGPQSGALTHEERRRKDGKVLRRGNIQDSIRIRMRRVGIKDSSYILRSYFDNRLLMAESHGVPELYRSFWMGHKGGLQMRYALRKEKLPPDVVEDMRRCYTKCLRFLETRRGDDAEQKLPVAEVFLRAAGYSPDQLQQLQVETRSKDEIIELIAQGPGRSAALVRAQKVVHSTELDAALLEGWFYKASLPDGRAIIERT